jgi:hypothetical protein
MIKFFRRIRQRLLIDNRFTKYLLYALGEIILVVIGILIALQINNWNESRKNANFEKQILESFQLSLESDLADIQDNISTHRRGLAACDSLIRYIEDDREIHEDTLARLFAYGIFATRFVYSTSAFESLKGKGVNIISNNELQTKIVDVYDSRYRFFLESENDYVDYYMLGLHKILPGRFEESLKYDLTQPGYPGNLSPLDFKELKHDKEFIYYLKTMRNWTHLLIEFHYAALQTDVEELVQMIDEELKLIEGS